MSIRLPESIAFTEEDYSMLKDSSEKYWFHFKPSFPDMNPSLYKKIISNASISIDIWDPHLHESTDCVIFTDVKQNVTIRILTQKSLSGRYSNFPRLFYEKMQEVIPHQKNVSFCLGVINKYQHENKIWEFHDRFLIIDQEQIYLIGASIEYNHVSKMGSGIYKVTNHETAQFIMELFYKYWEQTIKLPSEVQLLHH